MIRQTLCHYIKADRQTCLRGVTAATVGPEMEGKTEGRRGGGREGGICRAAVMGGEGAPCLHFVWNEEQAEGCVKDTEDGQECVCVFLFLHRCVFVFLCVWTCMHACVCV